MMFRGRKPVVMQHQFVMRSKPAPFNHQREMVCDLCGVKMSEGIALCVKPKK